MSGHKTIDPSLHIQDLQSAFYERQQDNNKVEEVSIDPSFSYTHPTLATAALIERLNTFHKLQLQRIEHEEEKAEYRMRCMEYIVSEMNAEARHAQNEDENKKEFEVSDELLAAILYFQNNVWPEFNQTHSDKERGNPFPDYVAVTHIHVDDVLDITKRLEMLMTSERRLLNKQGMAIKNIFEIDHLMSTLGAEELKNGRKMMEAIQRNCTPR